MIQLLCVLGVLSQVADDASYLQLFESGQGAYERGEFQLAADTWTRLARSQPNDPAVFYNIGNAYFKLSIRGRAVLNWERARRLDPRDRDTLENLEFVQQLLVDEVPVTGGRLSRSLERIAGSFTFDETLLTALTLWVLVGLASLFAILAKPQTRRIALAIAALAGVCLLAVSPFALWHIKRATDDSRAVVLAQSVSVRSGPGERYVSVFTVHEGLIVNIRQTASGWHRVRLPNGLDGWIASDVVERV